MIIMISVPFQPVCEYTSLVFGPVLVTIDSNPLPLVEQMAPPDITKKAIYM